MYLAAGGANPFTFPRRTSSSKPAAGHFARCGDMELSPLQLNLIIGFGSFILGAALVPPLLWKMRPEWNPTAKVITKESHPAVWAILEHGTADEWPLSDI